MAGDSSLVDSKCPVDHRSKAQQTDNTASCPIDHSSLSTGKAQRQTRNEPTSETSEDRMHSACPADHTRSLNMFLSSGDPTQASQQQQLDPHNQMPVVPEQRAFDGQQNTLSTARIVSTIPRAARYQSAGDSACPALHDDNDKGKEKKDMWIYPSEQMFFNAMKRKKWDPKEPDMKYVVPIHNAVNEMCWSQILDWEKTHRAECGAPKLLKFEGRAHDLSPRARFFSLIGYQKPFDRHDWTVDRCGKPVRYVIDFYEGKRDVRNPQAPSFYLDVRPALTLESSLDRMRRFFFGR